MSIIIKVKRGNRTERLNYIYSDGELVLEKDSEKIYYGDGVTRGGNLLIPNKSYGQPFILRNFKELIFCIPDLTGYNFTTITLTQNRLYFIPFMVNRKIKVVEGGIYVDSADNGDVTLAIYENNRIKGEDIDYQLIDNPGNIITMTDAISTSNSGLQYSNFQRQITLEQGELYWLGVLSRSTADIYALDYKYAPCYARDNRGRAFSYFYLNDVDDWVENPKKLRRKTRNRIITMFTRAYWDKL